MRSIFLKLTQHLRDVDESYFVHMRHAFYFSRNCFAASAALLIHCLAPFLFITTGSSRISRLYNIMMARAQISTSANSSHRNVAIVGFGLSGFLTFYNLVKNYHNSSAKLTVRIFEKSPFFAKGIAYSTKNNNHLLNVSAGKMSVEDDPEGFFNWLVAKGYSYQKTDFVPRQIFGLYLEDLLKSVLKIADEKGISYKFLHKEITEIGLKSKHFIIDGNAYNYCVYATGVQLKNDQNNFWNLEVEKFLLAKEIYIKGSGLTAFDAITALHNLNYQGKILLYSRSKKMPQVHKIFDAAQKVSAPLTIADASLPLSLIFQKFVKACKNSADWRLGVDAMRPITQEFWQNLGLDKQKRFLRHCFGLWNIHRHRCPSVQFALIKQLLDQQKLIFTNKKPEGQNTIDCTGFDYGFTSKFISNLIANNIAQYDALKAGIIAKSSNFYVMGGLSFGSLLEITAAPDIAIQARQTSQKILQS